MHAHERGVLGHQQAHCVLLRVMLPFLAVAFHSTPVSAQPTSGGFASVVVSAASIEDGTSVAVTGGLGYRLTRSLTLGIELTSVPSLDPDVPSVPSIPVIQASSPIVYPVPPPIVSYEAEGGHAVVFTANLRLDVPTQRRVAPYFVGGAGVGSITDRFHVTTSYPSIVFPATQVPTIATGTALPLVPTLIFPPPVVQSISHRSTDFAVTIGGGATIRTGPHLAFELDVRYLGFLGSRDLNVGRYGAGISYVF
jgi:Outer membrane protein beta-barrel domain